MSKIDRLNNMFTILILIALIVMAIGITLSIIESVNEKENYYDEAMFVTPDNALVIGKLLDYDLLYNNRMYKLKMNDGRTYLVPYTRLTLISSFGD